MGRSMTLINLPHIQRFKDRNGHLRHYYRRKGRKAVALPGAPGSPEFLAAYYAAAASAAPDAAAPKTGTIAALVASYQDSAKFSALRVSTQAVQRRILAAFVRAHGDKPVRGIQSEHVHKLMDAKATTPGAANKFLAILRVLLDHAVARGMRSDNPARTVKKVRYEAHEHPAWSEDDIAAFEAAHPSGSRARLAFALLLYTGQRRSDVIRMGRQHVRNGLIAVTQRKTRAQLRIPIHGELQREIDALRHNHLTFLVTRNGAPFASETAFYNWFVACVHQAGLRGLSPHGLRKSAARRLAEAGCTPSEIGAITGHRTLGEVERYTRAADQERMAREAMRKLR